MYHPQFETPIALIIFKRPDTTEKVFEVIRQVKPSKLLVIADGPRGDRPDEAEKCEATRAIIDRVDWKCEVLKNYSDINLGCARRVSSGLNWVFEQVEEAIILEDDCIPHATFFPFCEELLERYRNDDRIMSISAQNIQFGRQRSDFSYYFSRYHHCWGWATWSRAWRYFDFDMKLWPEVQSKQLLYEVLMNHRSAECWKQLFQLVHSGQVDSWAFRWTLSCWLQSGLSVIPNVNLVSNIGFGEESTHTKSKKNKFAYLPTEAIEVPLHHPTYLIRNVEADNFTQKTVFEKSRIDEIKIALRKAVGR